MKISLRGPHTLDLPTLRKRVEERVAHYAARYPKVNLGEHYRWVDERTAQAEYRGGSARITLGASDVGVDLSLPFIALPYRGRIEDFIRREIQVVTQPGGESVTAK